jgi:O-antigen/teichoic acid export membrane protein
MVRNSLYLILSSGLQATLGFAFWIITARLFSTTDVGRASSLISATTVIAYLALLGLNSTFVRYLPTARDRNALISAGLLLVAVCGAGIGLLYIFATPVLAPRLAFIYHQPALAAGFVLLTAAAAVNLLTDSIFIASRKAGYCALTDGGVGGTIKVVSGVLLSGTGAYGLFCASVGGFASAALASLVLVTTALHWRPSFRKPMRTLKPLLRFSGANYAGNVLNMLPPLVVPLVVLDRLGAQAVAYYFVAFQVATLLYSGAYAVGQTFLAEGSRSGVDSQELLRRSRRVLMAMCIPACLVLAVAAHWVLLLFGTRYSQHGTPSLILLALAAIPMAANNWLWTVLRLSGRLRALVLSSGVYAIAICGLAWSLAPHGLTGLTAAWPIGCLLSATVAAVAAVPKKAPARHQRTARTQSGVRDQSHRGVPPKSPETVQDLAASQRKRSSRQALSEGQQTEKMHEQF